MHIIQFNNRQRITKEDSENVGKYGKEQVTPKGNQSWIFVGRTDAKAETPILWPPDARSWLIGKDPDAWKDWRQKEKGMTEDEMVGQHHQLNGYEFRQSPGVGDVQGSLTCYSPWGCKELDNSLLSCMTEQLNWTGGKEEEPVGKKVKIELVVKL